MTSLKYDLLYYLKTHPDWHAKGFLTDTTPWYYYEKGIKKKYLAETVGRKLRELEEESKIARKDLNESCQYKFLPVEMRSKYIPYSLRTDNKLFHD